MNGWTRSCRQCVCAPQAGRAARQATYSQHTHGAGATTHACAMHMRIRKEICNYCCGTHECPMTSTSASISTSSSELFPWIGHRRRPPEQKPPARVCRVSSGWRIVATEMQPSADERFSIVALSARRWWHAIARVPCPPILLGFAKTAIRSYVSRVSDGHNMVFYLYFLVKSNLKVGFYLKLVKCKYDTNVFKKHNN
jgi:hypothetical protein